MASSLLFLFALVAAGSASNSGISPTQYTLSLYLDTSKDVFSGTLEIDAEVLAGGAVNFQLHNDGLNIATVSVVQNGAEMFRSFSTDPSNQLIKINLTHGLVKTKLKITIAYQGTISTDPTGLYSFIDQGKKFYMTNLYPIHARKLFPCWDEPGVSAAISLSLTVPQSSGRLIASTEIMTQTTVDGTKSLYQLATTPTIAPYSLFFTLGEWSSDSYSLPSTRTILWLPPSLTKNTNDLDGNIVDVMGDQYLTALVSLFTSRVNVFVTPALSGDSYSGLGALVLSKHIVINDLAETTTEMQKEHFIKIATALYKVFYGTHVRPSNWGNAWLAESLPTYLAYCSLGQNKRYGTSEETLVTGLYEYVFRHSWSEKSPVAYKSSPPTTPADIMSFIQSSGMAKGVYALTSLETVVDKSDLLSAVFAFLVRNNGSAVDTVTFAKSLQATLNPQIIGGTLSSILLPMLSEPGYPLIVLHRNQLTLTISKTSFVSSPVLAEGVSQFNDVSDWLLPVTTTTSMSTGYNSSSVYYVPSNANGPVDLAGIYPENGWALLNLDAKALMRISYDVQSSEIFKILANSSFPPVMRAKLIADSFASAESGTQPWLVTLSYLQSLDDETELAPWTVALSGFRRMWSWIYHTGTNGNSTENLDLKEAFQAYVMTRLDNVLTKVGTDATLNDALTPLRRIILAAACDFGDSHCVSTLADQYQAMVNNKIAVSSDMFSVVVCNGLKGVSAVQNWNKVYQTYVTSGKWYTQQLIDSHFEFLACPERNDTETSEPINEFLDKVLLNTSKAMFPIEQVKSAVRAIVDRPEHVDQVLNFFIENIKSLNITTDLQAEVMQVIGERLSTKKQADVLQAYLDSKATPAPALEAAVRESITKALTQVDKIHNIQQDVLSGLEEHSPSTGTAGPLPPHTTSSPAHTTPSGGGGDGGGASTATASILALLIALVALTAAK